MNIHAILLPRRGHQVIAFPCKTRLSRGWSTALALLLTGLACLGMSPDARAQTAQTGVCGAPTDGVVRCDAETYQPGESDTGSIDYSLIEDGNLQVELAPGLQVNVSSATSDTAAVDLDDNDMARTGDMTIIMEDGVHIRTDHTATPDAGRANGISGIQGRFNSEDSMGRIAVILRRGSIWTRGDDASGVALFHDGENGASTPIGRETAADVAIHLMSMADITTLGAGSPGIHAEVNAGRLIVDLQGGRIVTSGDMLTADPNEPDDHVASSGVFVESSGGGMIAVRVGAAAGIQASGAGAHGIAVSGAPAGEAAGGDAAATFDAVCQNTAFAGGICIQGIVEGGRSTGRGVHLTGGGVVVVAGDRGLLKAASGTAIETETGDLDIHLVGIARIEGRIIGDADAETRVNANGIPLLGEARNPRTGEMIPNSILSGGRAPAGPYDTYLRETQEPNVWELENRYSVRAAAFEALPQILLQLNNRSSYRPGPGAGTRKARGAWFDIAGQYGQHEPDDVTSLQEYNNRWWRPRLGYETLLPWGKQKNWLAGAHIHLLYGYADDIRTPDSSATAIIDTDGYGFGAHLEWQGPHGMHAGLHSALSWYETETRASFLNADTDAFGWLLEGHLGRTLAISSQTSITPRADLSYSRVNLDNLTAHVNPLLPDSRYQVTFSDAISIKGRLGVDLEWLGRSQGRIRQTRLYATPGLVHEFDGNTEALVGLEQLVARAETLWGEITLGGSMTGANFLGWGHKFELFGELSAALSGDSREFGLNTGVRVSF